MCVSQDGSKEHGGLFGAVDIGQGAYWWDYGQLKLYFANNVRVTGVSFTHTHTHNIT